MSRSTRSKRPEPAARLASRLVAAALAAALAATASAAAQSTNAAAPPADAPAHVRKYLGDARLAGAGRLTWLGFHVYDAALYVPPGFSLASADRQPFVLELTYARRLEGGRIAEASGDEIERLGFGSKAQRARWNEQMRRLFPDVTRGQRLAGVNVPGVGARFYSDGRFLGSVDDPAFAQAFFAIWLDERTRAPQLRESLLDGAPALRTAGA